LTLIFFLSITILGNFNAFGQKPCKALNPKKLCEKNPGWVVGIDLDVNKIVLFPGQLLRLEWEEYEYQTDMYQVMAKYVGANGPEETICVGQNIDHAGDNGVNDHPSLQMDFVIPCHWIAGDVEIKVRAYRRKSGNWQTRCERLILNRPVLLENINIEAPIALPGVDADLCPGEKTVEVEEKAGYEVVWYKIKIVPGGSNYEEIGRGASFSYNFPYGETILHYAYEKEGPCDATIIRGGKAPFTYTVTGVPLVVLPPVGVTYSFCESGEKDISFTGENGATYIWRENYPNGPVIEGATGNSIVYDVPFGLTNLFVFKVEYDLICNAEVESTTPAKIIINVRNGNEAQLRFGFVTENALRLECGVPGSYFPLGLYGSTKPLEGEPLLKGEVKTYWTNSSKYAGYDPLNTPDPDNDFAIVCAEHFNSNIYCNTYTNFKRITYEQYDPNKNLIAVEDCEEEIDKVKVCIPEAITNCQHALGDDPTIEVPCELRKICGGEIRIGIPSSAPVNGLSEFSWSPSGFNESNDGQFVFLNENDLPYGDETRFTRTETNVLTGEEVKTCYNVLNCYFCGVEPVTGGDNKTSFDSKSSNSNEFEISIYPNPVVDNVFVVGTNAIEIIEIIDLLGKVHFSERFEKQSEIEVQLGNTINAGFYLIKVISTKNETVIKSLIIK
jgi:hypothetical protein